MPVEVRGLIMQVGTFLRWRGSRVTKLDITKGMAQEVVGLFK